MEQRHLNQTVLCSDSQLPRSQANTRQQHSNPASMTTNWLQQGSFIHQHPNPTSVPMNQFHQSQASVSIQQHSYPASMHTNQLNSQQPVQCSSNIPTKFIHLVIKLQQVMISYIRLLLTRQCSHGIQTFEIQHFTYSRQLQGMCCMIRNRKIHKQLKMNPYMKTCFKMNIFM